MMVITFTMYITMQETLMEMKRRASSIACDWVARSLYWLEESDERYRMNAVMKHDLHRDPDTSTSAILPRPTSVAFGSIQVDPSRR